jgi:exodeoxyribonuclease V alpha subunit
VLFVGDIDQLPSVGAGNVLRDIIDAIEGNTGQGPYPSTPPGKPAPGSAQNVSARAADAQAGSDQKAFSPLPNAKVVRLDTIFRQSEGSYIITNAHRINRGQMPVLDNKNSVDFFLFKEEDPEKAAALVVELVKERIPRKFGLAPEQIQVLSPMHRGTVGVGSLNAALQAALNPPRPGAPERAAGGRVFRMGDRVMQIRNNYDKEVFNGDMGQIGDVDLEDQVVTVQMEDRLISYDFLELDELVHAYAVSVHKSQGSEFPAVVIPLLSTHYMMLQRNLLYTGVTRAQKLVVLVGTPRAVAIAAQNDQSRQRYSGLAERLTAG